MGLNSITFILGNFHNTCIRGVTSPKIAEVSKRVAFFPLLFLCCCCLRFVLIWLLVRLELFPVSLSSYCDLVHAERIWKGKVRQRRPNRAQTMQRKLYSFRRCFCCEDSAEWIGATYCCLFHAQLQPIFNSKFYITIHLYLQNFWCERNWIDESQCKRSIETLWKETTK